MSAHSMQAQPRLSQYELLQFKWLLGNLLALVSLWTLMYIDVQTMGLLSLTALAVFISILKPSLPGYIPRIMWTVVIPICLSILVITDFFLSQPDIVPPLVRMLLLLMLVRCLQNRRRREDLQLILMCLFMVMLVGVLTLSITFGIQMLIFTPIAMGMLFLITITEPNEREASPEQLDYQWETFYWKPFLSRIWRVQNFPLLGLISMLFFGVLAVSSIIFIMMPRFQLNQAIPFLNVSTNRSISGFSDRIHFGDIVDILEDNSVALRVDVDDQDGTPLNPYWRMVVLDEYNHGSFQMSWTAREYRTTVRTHFFRVAGQSAMDRDQLKTWTFYLEGGISKYLPAVGLLSSMRFQNRQEIEINDPLKLINSRHISSKVLFYQTESFPLMDIIPAFPQDRRLQGQKPISVVMPTSADSPVIEYPFTTLVVPAGEKNIRTLDTIIQEITGGEALSARDFSSRAVDYLQAHHAYSLRVHIPDGDHDVMIRWLESDQPGHCELFAGAFTLLARRAGYPARLVTGFMGGAWNGYEQYYMVRNKNAHAWAEVYDGAESWFRVDPTPSRTDALSEAGSGGIAALLDIDRTWGAYFDSLRIIWYRRIVKFDRDQQRELAGHVRQAGIGMVVEFKRQIRSVTEKTRVVLAHLWSGSLWIKALYLLIAGSILVMLIRLLPSLLDYVSSLRSGSKGFTHPIRRKAAVFIKRFRASTPDSTPASEEWSIVYRHLLQIRFGDQPEWPNPYDVFRHARVLLKRKA